jgi:prepilin-type N-terminal cleavage/methylation domain-containing protein
MKSIRSIASCNKGFTLIELLVSSSLGLLLIALVMASVLANRQLFKQDMVRTQIFGLAVKVSVPHSLPFWLPTDLEPHLIP